MPMKTVNAIWRTAALAVLTAGLAGCIYANTTLPLAWISNTRLDVKDLNLENQEIIGQATAYGLLFGLISWGNAGLDAALENAKLKAGFEVKEVYDVKTDQRVFNVLGLYFSRTIIITAKAAH
ncbi:MAG TPA: TRL domain-containing protein [Nitrospiria bacterium]|nr:TRL domain-containing protein [Nitrospiria bacterium]